MRRSRIACAVVAIALATGVAPASGLNDGRSWRAAAIRVVGPNNEPVPVLNEGGASLQLKVVDAANATIPSNTWRTDSLGVATVNRRSGVVEPVETGFATVYAQTSQGEAKCFVAVMRVRDQTGGQVQGDTKADTAGRLYLSDPVHHVIVRAQGGQSERWVGANDQSGFADGQGTQSRFHQPAGLAVDLSAQGGLYIADSLNHCIRKASFDGRVGTGQRGSVVVGEAETPGTTVGSGPFEFEGFRLNGPQGVVSVGGNLYITDTENHCVWYADVARRRVTLVAGKAGEPGLLDGIGGAARFNRPSGLAINTRGNLLAVADTGNDVVRLIRIGRDASSQQQYRVSTIGVASSGRVRDAARVAETDDLADAVIFDDPRSVSIDGVENVYVIDEQTATVVTRPEEAEPIPVALAADGELDDAVSLTLQGTQALVLDGSAASADKAVRVVEVGAPLIEDVSVDEVTLAGGEEVVVDGSNFAPESVLTYGDVEVETFEVESARRIRFSVPPLRAPGARTLTIATRGGVAQRSLVAHAKPFGELAVGEITTVAGGIATIGDGGPAAAAPVFLPNSVAIDAAGNLFVADQGNRRVRRVDAATGLITTVAGTGVGGYDGDDKPAITARLTTPFGIALDAAGNLFIADQDDHRVRRVDAGTGLITTVAGTGVAGYDGEDLLATETRLNTPGAVALDAEGNLFIAEYFGQRVRRIDAVTKRIATVAGTGTGGYNGDDIPAAEAQLSGPNGIALNAAGDLFIADRDNDRVRRVDAVTNRITTVAGVGFGPGEIGDGVLATEALIHYPTGVAVDDAGNLFLAESIAGLIRKVDAVTGRISTVAGRTFTPNARSDGPGDGGPATEATLYYPTGIVVDAVGNLFIADSNNDRIRRVDAASQRISTVVGTGVRGFVGDDGPAIDARLNFPGGVAVDRSGDLFVADTYNHRIRRVDAGSQRIRTVAGTSAPNYGDNGDGGPATSAHLWFPSGVAVDKPGNVFIADAGNNLVRKVDASTKRIESIWDRGYVTGVAVDVADNLFIAETYYNFVRRIDASTGENTTVAGSFVEGYEGDGGPATEARLNRPRGAVSDAEGNVFIADTLNHCVRRVDASTRLISTVAGTGIEGYGGDDGPAMEAQLAYPHAVAVDGAGNVFIADEGNHCIRRIDAATKLISTVAGTGVKGYGGDGGPGISAELASPRGIALDAAGNLYIADTSNGAIRIVRGPIPHGGVASPAISAASFAAAAGKLKISGMGFGTSGATVEVNGTDVSAAVRKQKDRRLVLRGTASELGLRTGANEIVVTVGGRGSNVYVINL